MKHHFITDWLWGIALTIAVLFTYAWVQNADDAAHKMELAWAKQQGYHTGYNTGSNAGLAAAHKSCETKIHMPSSACDLMLANATVLAAGEGQ